MPDLEITEKIIVHVNVNNNDYQLDSKFLYTFVPSKPLGKLWEISRTNLKTLNMFYSKFLYIVLWFSEQKSKPLEIEDKVNLILVTNWYITYKIRSRSI